MHHTRPIQKSKLMTFFLPILARRPMFKRHMHETLERRISRFFAWQFCTETFMFNASSSKPISSISETAKHTLRSTRQPKSFEVAPHIKTVSFHFQTSVCGIKWNITKKKTVLWISKNGTSCMWASETGWSCVSCWGASELDHHLHKTSKRHICPKPWKVQVFQ